MTQTLTQQTYTGKTLTNLTDLIGGTPLLPISSLPRTFLQVHAKLESSNPGGTLYDRLALSRIRRAEAAGLIREGTILLDASEGEYSVSVAMLGATLGYTVRCVIDSTCSLTKEGLLIAYGADVVRVENPSERRRRALELMASDHNLFLIDGSNLPVETSAPLIDELVDELGHAPDLVLMPAGAAELIEACRTRLAAVAPSAVLLTVALNGYDGPVQDDEARNVMSIPASMYRRRALDLVRSEGILAGPESGAVWAAVHHYLANRQLDLYRPLRVVLVLPDHGDRWLSWLCPAAKGPF